MKRILVAFALLVLASQAGLPAPVRAAGPLDFDIEGGHFYTQTAGDRVGEAGFAVRDDAGARFWTAFQDYGGPEGVGYPISHRFLWNGLTSQAFQKVIFQWNPGTGTVSFVNVFDQLSEAGRDDWLLEQKMTPRPIALDERGFSFEQIRAGRLALLKSNPAIEARYFAAPDPLLFFGLPTSRPEDMGNAVAVRFQRAVMQQWKIDVPWARAGDVVVANGGDLAKEAGLLPAAAITPVSASTPLSAPSAPPAAPPVASTPTPSPTPTPTSAPAPPPAAPPPGPEQKVLSPTGPEVPIPATEADGVLLVAPVLTGSKKPGATATLEVTVTFKDGRPFRGAGVAVIASFDDYDDVFFMPNTDANGKTSYPVPIHSTVSSGSQVRFKVQAFFPYYTGVTRFTATVD